MTPALNFPPPLLDQLRHWGPRWHEDITLGRDAMLEAFARWLRQPDEAGLEIHRNLRYGDDPRQVLDIYRPPGLQGAPVVVFVHGGAFVRGDKDQPGGLYGNVAREFARHGWLALNVEYRLAPQAPWPAGARDVRTAVLWAAAHSKAYGGDPRALFLFGHSAGSAHCSSAAWDARLGPALLPLAGLVLASPRIRADIRPENPNAHGVLAYYGEDTRLHDDRAPLAHVRPDASPTFVAIAQYENPLIDLYGFELAHVLAQLSDRQGGPMPRLVQYPEHNHVSLVAQFDTPFSRLGPDVRDWSDRVLRGEFRAATPAEGH